MIHNFKRLIKKYSTGRVLAKVNSEGYYDMEQGGKWIEKKIEDKIVSPAAIVPLSNDDLKFDGGGTYSHDNRKLYCYERLPKGTFIENVQEDGTVKLYKILAEKDYSDFDTGLHIYFLERGERDNN